jgi:hypothetical protein
MHDALFNYWQADSILRPRAPPQRYFSFSLTGAWSPQDPRELAEPRHGRDGRASRFGSQRALPNLAVFGCFEMLQVQC